MGDKAKRIFGLEKGYRCCMLFEVLKMSTYVHLHLFICMGRKSDTGSGQPTRIIRQMLLCTKLRYLFILASLKASGVHASTDLACPVAAVRLYTSILTLCSPSQQIVTSHIMSASKANSSLSRLGSIRSAKYQSTGSVGELGETVSLYDFSQKYVVRPFGRARGARLVMKESDRG